MNETKMMELQLAHIQDQMKSENEDGEAPRHKWRSSNISKGPITNYGKAFRRRKKDNRRSSSQRKKKSGSPKTWNVDRVCAWLTSIGLPQYKKQFQENSVTGTVLLEMEREDMDYLSIRFPAHRKMILNGIHALRERIQGPKNKTTVDASSLSSSSAEGYAKTISPSRSVHWSVAAARAHEDAVRNPTEPPPVNTADNDAYDEAKQRRLFQEAVMEWRHGGGSGAKDGSGGEESDTWTNPTFSSSKVSPTGNSTDDGSMHDVSSKEKEDVTEKKKPDLLNGEYDEIAQRRAFKNAVMAWRRGHSKEPSPKMDVTISTKLNSTSDGDLDEVLERTRFKKAVEQWRKGGSGNDEAVQTLQSKMDEKHNDEMEALRRRRKEISESAQRKRSDQSDAIRTLERRIYKLRVEEEKSASAVPLTYDVWEADISF
eukprot:g115.t1